MIALLDHQESWSSFDDIETIQWHQLRAEQKPHGLSGDSTESCWMFEPGARYRAQRMPWKWRFSDGLSITDDIHAAHWELARRYFSFLRNGCFTVDPAAVATCILQTYDALRIIRYVHKQGYASIAAYPASRLDELLSAAARLFSADADQNMSAHQVGRVFSVISDLHEFSQPAPGGRYLNDGFSFQPFSSPQDMYALARVVGREGGTTKDIPHEVVFALMNASIEFVTDYADDLIKLHRQASSEMARLQAADQEKPSDYSTVAQFLLDTLRSGVRSLGRTVFSIRDVVHSATQIDIGVLSRSRYKTLFMRCAKVMRRKAARFGEKLQTSLMVIIAKGQAPLAPFYTPVVAKKIGLPFSGKPGPAAPWPIEHCGSSPRKGRSLESAVGELWTSCYVILAASMGDRYSETFAHRIDCLKSGVDGYYLETPNFKARDPEGGTFILQPCPKIVAMVVRVLLSLGEAGRIDEGLDKLFLIRGTFGRSPSPESINDRMNAFGKRVGAMVYDNGRKVWRIASHQLRRFFATIWVNYYEYGGRFEALRKMLDHTSLSTTLRYAAKRIQGDSISTEQRALAHRVMRALAFEGVEAQGPAAKYFEKLIGRMRLRFVPEDRISEWLATRVDRLKYEYNPMPWGYCAWSKLSGLSAKCVEPDKRRTGMSRPIARKNACTCGDGCAQFLTTDNFNPFWATSYERHARVAGNPAAPRRMVAAAQRGMNIAIRFGGGKSV